jgi:D-alanine--poly(phosphoribitol) ligase subunit 2
MSDAAVEKNVDTPLVGKGSTLDSLGIVNLIVIIEENINSSFELSITIADEKAMSQKRSPFLNVGTLADYIFTILNP